MTKTKATKAHFNYSYKCNSLKKRKCGVEIGLKMPCDFPQLLFQLHVCECVHIFCHLQVCSVPILCRLSVTLSHSAWLTLFMLIYNCNAAILCWRSISKQPSSKMWKLQQMVPLMVDFCVVSDKILGLRKFASICFVVSI